MSECRGVTRYKGSLRCSKVAGKVSFAKRGYVEDLTECPPKCRKWQGRVSFCQGWVS
jgi:hypothetical protein